MPYPINATHRLLLEDGTSYLLLEDNSSKIILDEAVALDDPLNAGTVSSTTPGLTFAGESLVASVIPAIVQTNSVNNASASPGTIAMSSLTVGNKVIITTTVSVATANIVSGITDNATAGSNTYTKITESNNAAGESIALWYADIVHSGATSISIAFNAASTNMSAIAREYSGLVSGAPDKFTSATDTSTSSHSSGSTSTTTQAYELLIGAIGIDNNSSLIQPGSGFGNIVPKVGAAASGIVSMEDQLVTSIGTYAATFTTTGGGVDSAIIIATFKITTIPTSNLEYEIEVDTVNTFDSQAATTEDSYTAGASNTANVDGGTAGSGQTSQAAAMSFTAGSNYTIGQIGMYIKKFGSPVDSITLSLYGGSINGTLLSTSGTVAGGTITTSFVLYTFTLNTPTALTSGTKYYIQATRTPDSFDGSNGYQIQGASGNPYANGGLYSRDNNVWSSESSNFELNFITTSTTTPILDSVSDLNIGFADDTTTSLGDDRLELESGSYLLLEDNSSKIAINYSYPSGDYLTYTVPSGVLSNSTTYYWRVRDKIVNGVYGTWSEIRSFTVSAGAHTQSLTAALSFTGNQSKSTGYILSGALSFVGSTLRTVTRSLTAAALSFTGAFSKTPKMVLAGVLSFTGSQSKQSSRALTGILSTGSGAATTFGTTSSAGTTTGGLTEIAGVFYNMPVSGTVTKLSFYSPNNGNAVGAIYDDSSGAPNNLVIANNTPTAITGGQFNDITITPTHLVAGNYWLTFMTDSSSMRAYIASGANGGHQTAYNLSTTYGASFPGTFPTPSYQADDYPSYATYTPDGANTFTKQTNRALTGALSFAGNVLRSIAHALSGVLSFTGAHTGAKIGGTLYTQSLTAALSFTGSQIKTINHILSGALSFAGSLAKATAHLLSATLSFSGSIARSVLLSLTGALSFTGAFIRRITRTLTGALSFSGAQTRAIVKTAMTATLTFTGTFNKTLNRALTGALSFAGVFAKLPGKALSGVLSFTGNIPSHFINAMLTGSLSFTGSLSRTVRHSLTAALSFTGSLVYQMNRALSATLSFTGNFIHGAAHFMSLTGSLSFTGAFSKSVNKVITGALSFSGAMSRSIRHSLTGVLSFSGNLNKTLTRALSAALSFAGSFLTAAIHHQALTATLSFTGAFSRQILKPLTATLSFSGALTRVIRRSLSATLSFTGNFIKSAARTLSGALSFTGAIAHGSAFFRSLSGTLSFSGAMNRSIAHNMTAALSFTGNLSRSMIRALTATLSFVGSFTKRLVRSMAGTLSFTGNFLAHSIYIRVFTATLTFSGSMLKSMMRGLSATLSFSGNMNRSIVRSLTATLTFSGSFLRRMTRALNATLSFSGSFGKGLYKSFTGTLSFVGGFTKLPNKAFTASLSFVGTFLSHLTTIFRPSDPTYIDQIESSAFLGDDDSNGRLDSNTTTAYLDSDADIAELDNDRDTSYL